MLLCERCRLISTPAEEWPDPEAERERYRLHRNSLDDPRYVAFLEQLLRPVAGRVSPATRGLDFGCGPVPVLAELARRRGFQCQAYDPLFGPREIDPPYDFVLASEVFEHFAAPRREIERILEWLVPRGILAVMTERWTRQDRLAGWHYLSDRTHRVFYHTLTFRWIAWAFGLEIIEDDGARVVLFRTGPGSGPRLTAARVARDRETPTE